MKITIESTTKIVTADGIQCRVWEGTSEGGVPVYCLIPRIAAHAGADLTQFEKELQEQCAPSVAATRVFSSRMIL